MWELSRGEAQPLPGAGAQAASRHFLADGLADARHEQLLVALCPHIPWVADAQGNLLAFHHRWSELTGLSEDACAGLGWLQAVHPDCRPAFMAVRQQALSTCGAFDARFRCRTKDGSYRWMRARGSAWREAGEEVRWYGLTEDIHDQVVAEDALRESEENYRYTVELSPHMGFVAGPDGTMLDLSPRWLTMLGMSREEAQGSGWTKAVHPEDLSAMLAGVVHSVRTGEPYDMRGRFCFADETYRWVRVQAYARRNGAGEIVRWYGTTTDIHEQVLAEQALRESEAHYRCSVELSPHISWVGDASGGAIELGPLWHQLTGLTPEETQGDGWMKGIHPDDLPAMLAVWHHSIRTAAPYCHEFRVLLRDGSTRWFRSRGAPRRNEEGEIIRWYGAFEDIHEQKLAEQALSDSEEHYRYAIELSPYRSWTTEPDGSLVEISSKWLEALGMSRAEALGYGWLKAVHADDLPRVTESVRTTFPSGRPFDYQLRFRMADGSYRWQRAQAAPRRNEQGEIIRWYGMNTDIHDLVLAQQAVQESEERFRLAARAAGLGVWDYDAASDTLSWSSELRTIFGVSADEPPSFKQALRHVHPEDRGQIEQFLKAAYSHDYDRFEATLRVRHSSDGTLRWVATNGWKTMQAGKLSRLIITARDVTEEKTAEDRIRWSATHDALTRLPNRALFQDELIEAIEHARATHGNIGLMLVDVDHFKQINDTLGHDAGDAVLQAFALRMRASLRTGDKLARLGGDEFAIILPDVAGEDGIATAVDSIMARLRTPFIHGGRVIDCRATIGASLYPDHATDANDLLKAADIALYAAKAAGRGQMAVFRPAMREDLLQRAAMLVTAREALEADLIRPYYQPIIDMASGTLAGFEALLRWSHPEAGVQLPGTIAAAFEDPALAMALSDRILDHVIADMRRWLDAGLTFGHVAVNASAAEFRHNTLAERVLGKLEQAGVPPRCLELEVTESVFVGQGSEHVERALRLLSQAGVRIALDDFGTGFASLSHLRRFPVDVLKIDRSFVSNLEQDQDDAAIVRAVLSLSQSLDIRVVAEGIETPGQAAYLRQEGCDYGQGWLFAKAQPAAQVPAMIRSRKAQETGGYFTWPQIV